MFLIRFCRRYCACSLALMFFVSVAGTSVADESAESILPEINEPLTTNVDYRIAINGEIVTPSADGPQHFPLKSSGAFQFQNRTFPGQEGGPFALRAIRRFETAATSTTVGKEHTTKVVLSPAYRSVTVSGSESGLVVWSPNFALPRKQLDLLQMPFDPLAVRSLLPADAVKPGDRWNTDAWLTPMLTGIDAVITQTATCELLAIDDQSATVEFSGEIDGAAQGSASEISFNGKMAIDRVSGIVESFSATQNEKRSPGPVSPGLAISANITWTQQSAKESALAAAVAPEKLPSEQQQHLLLQTPLKLQLRHSREWHMFHETAAVLMMRQLRDGNLISQCNISSTVTVPPRQHTPDAEFLADVRASVAERKGTIQTEETVREDGQWRIRHVRAIGDAAGKGIVWDYYLCSAGTGEQFSVVFSHAADDEKAFGNEAVKLLSTLQIVRSRPTLPFR